MTTGATPTTTATDRSFVWTLAVVSGVVVYAVVLTLHLSRDEPGTTAFQVGQMTPVPLIATVLVGFVAPLVRRPHWPPWLMAVVVPTAIAVVVFGWYALLHVLPEMVDDARAEASGQADHRLHAPENAGDWARMDGKQVAARRDQILETMAQDPKMGEVSDVVYAEYRGTQSMLMFIGFNTSGEFQDELRASEDGGLDDLMAGARAVDVEDVDAGDLGGWMACAEDIRSSPVDVAFCAWADASTVGQVMIFDADLGIDDAAQLVREFRDHVTQR